MKPLKLILYSRFSNILYHQFVANLLQNAVPRKTGRFSRDKSLWTLQRNVCVVKFFSKGRSVGAEKEATDLKKLVYSNFPIVIFLCFFSV